MQTPIKKEIIKKPLVSLYIPAIQKNLDIQLSKSQIAKLPTSLFLAYSIQYKELAKQIKYQLQSNKIKIQKFQQVLGCSKVKTDLPILLISTGKFHAQNLYLQTPILYKLENNKIIKISNKEINKLKAKKKTALIKFLKADKIGVVVSTKPGQKKLKQALSLKQRLKKQNKQPFIFISNHIDINQFENFNIDSWVNTACSGIAMDNPNIINIDDLPREAKN
jgi:2-(3-amino-3-carboxypropyl)histidine synthase